MASNFSMILCEGKTDAILLSYLLIKNFEWEYIKTSKELPHFEIVKNNEEFNWYQHSNGSKCAIWGVGGFDNLIYKFKEVIERNIKDPNNIFGKIVSMFDCDKIVDEGLDVKDKLKEWLDSANVNLIGECKDDDWFNVKYLTLDSDPKELQSKILPIIIPPEKKEGNLEIFLLESLEKQGGEEEIIVSNAEEFIKTLTDKSITYLNSRRLPPKAQLGSVLSVFSPDWVFSELDRRLTLVDWSELPSLIEAYQKLEDLQS